MTSYVSENEAENPENGDVHINGIWHIEVSDGSFLAFFTLFHLSLTFSSSSVSL